MLISAFMSCRELLNSQNSVGVESVVKLTRVDVRFELQRTKCFAELLDSLLVFEWIWKLDEG